jgi:hypothetical protein
MNEHYIKFGENGQAYQIDDLNVLSVKTWITHERFSDLGQRKHCAKMMQEHANVVLIDNEPKTVTLEWDSMYHAVFREYNKPKH